MVFQYTITIFGVLQRTLVAQVDECLPQIQVVADEVTD